MRENVGGVDRTTRLVAGPALLALGYAALGGSRGSLPGLLAMISGAVIAETAITRVCPLNELLGIDTSRRDFGEALPPRRRAARPTLALEPALAG